MRSSVSGPRMRVPIQRLRYAGVPEPRLHLARKSRNRRGGRVRSLADGAAATLTMPLNAKRIRNTEGLRSGVRQQRVGASRRELEAIKDRLDLVDVGCATRGSDLKHRGAKTGRFDLEQDLPL
jgi:hypothetical protein